MYQVMLVDDDYPVIDFLQQEIPWEEMGLAVSGAYTDGQSALEGAKKQMPDILLTDIGMPRMDGLELIKQLRDLKPEMYCVILSCHDEFHYAQQAVKLGVHDYVLKASMTEDTVMETLDQVIDKLNQLREKSGEFTSLKKLVTQDYRKDRFMRYTGLDFEKHAYTPVLISVDQHRAALNRYQTEDVLFYAIQNATEELTAQYSPDTVCFRHLPLGVVMLIPKGQTIEMVLHRIQKQIQQHLKMDVSCFMVTNAFYSDPELLHECLSSLFKSVENLRFYTESESIINVNEQALPFTDERLFADYAETYEHIYRAILSEDADELEHFLLSRVEDIRMKRYKPDVVKEWFLKLLLDVRLNEAMDPQLLTKKSPDVLHTTVDQIHSLHELHLFALEFMQNRIKEIGKMRQQPNNQEVLKAQQYVLTNIDKKISLEDVAHMLHHNTSYFSRLFKRETGMNFSQYVISVKMERAKMYLQTTSKTVDEIALSLGYENKGYFLKLFKLHTGLTPTQYAGKEQVPH